MSDRSIRWLAACAVFLVGPAVADLPGARATLSLHDGKAAYVSGDAIVVDLEIDASEPVDIDRSTDTSRMDIDQIELAPTTDVYPWRADSERFTPRWGDSFTRYPASRQFRTTLTLNRRFRFDGEGTYRIHVVTRRVKPVLTTNDVSFTITRASSDHERGRAAALDQALRHAPDERAAGRLATKIDWLSDDAATEVKLALLLGPDKSDCYFRHDTTGLWIARDRQRVIDRLEQALVDPAEDIPMGSALVGTLIALKISQRFPDQRDANEPMAPRRGNVWTPGALEQETSALGVRYTHAIAETLPQRTGRSRIDAAQRVMWSKGRAPSSMDDADFRAAREVVIDHFEDVDPYNVDTDLGSLGRFFEDPRMIPKLKALLDVPNAGPFGYGRGLALDLLAKLDPSSSAGYIAKEACTDQPPALSSLRDLPLVSTPQADECFAAQIDAQSSASASRALQIRLRSVTLPYVARFASDRLLTKVAAIYPTLDGAPHDSAPVAAALAYLMRWDPQRYRPLLDAAADDQRNTYLAGQLASLAAKPDAGLRAFMRDRIASTPTSTTPSWILALGRIGEAEDKRFLQERLDRIRTSPSTLSNDVANQVAPLEEALRRGTSGSTQIPM